MIHTPSPHAPRAEPDLRKRLHDLCTALGDGHRLDDGAASGSDGGSAVLRTPDGGSVELQLDAHSLAARASGWPEVRRLGLQRRFGREIVTRLDARRAVADLAQDLQRRLLAPYAAALREERQRAQRYRHALQRVAATLQQSGFRERDAHVVGRQLLLQRPYAALDAGGTALPSDGTLSFALHDSVPVARIELRNLSPEEACAVQSFVDDLLAQRTRQLRLCA